MSEKLCLYKNGNGKTTEIIIKATNMHKDSFGFVYNAEGDYYDLVVDKKIQKVVEELKALPHDVLIRYLTYWSEAIDGRKYVVESDILLPCAR